MDDIVASFFTEDRILLALFLFLFFQQNAEKKILLKVVENQKDTLYNMNISLKKMNENMERMNNK